MPLIVTSRYPPKLHFRDKFRPVGSSASELVLKALREGSLDPDTHWSYEDIIDPHPMSAPIRRTAIHEAIKLQNLEAICFLMQNGADLSRASQDGLLPLHAALYEGDEEIFFTLLEGGANLETASNYE
ncbi:hypothetical protein CSOJ01_11151 [Colletotrichum sojae]|uniref:Ankyrin repeat protein n=1 Tax=Colletotrichum sojae TaxID=2175907 RepID=A0A8H6MNG6_9PEZI|nr:hypothetical protein CSOJ01_11151 [Colletotrichum sojae]